MNLKCVVLLNLKCGVLLSGVQKVSSMKRVKKYFCLESSCGTHRNLKCGTLWNLECGTTLNLKCETKSLNLKCGTENQSVF